ncbi:MAG: glucosaminidase domain-containing protein [Saprospiraceae bacterium]
MLKKSLFFILFSSLTFFVVYGQSDSREAYIKKYKKIAIKEMERTGVPASIKLAQGILESNGGKSTLARKANNHFGMKCGSQWTGKTYFLEDDDYDANGRLIKSCFRVYRKAKDSYVAHSEFLRDPRKRYRYGFLFELKTTDYKAWARGLKKAGYATSPTYAEKLISLIERHELNRFDKMSSGNGDVTPDPDDQIFLAADRTIINGIDVVIADGQKTVRDIALNNDVKTKCLVKYNEKLKREAVVPEKGTKVFLKKKRSGYRGKDKKYHLVRGTETMYEISQMYGVRLNKLLKRNRLESGEQPRAGQKIKLRGWFKIRKKPRLRDTSGEVNEFEEEEESQEGDGFMDNSETIDFEKVEREEPEESEDFDTLQEEVFEDDDGVGTETGNGNPEPAGPAFHIVVKGETLYGIARRYDTTVERIKELSKLTASNIISVGQRLRVR